MDMEAQQQINRQITSTERVLWADRPKRGFVYRGSDIFLTIFAIIWLAIIFPGFSAALRGENAPSFAILFMIPFIVAGLWLLVGRHIHDAWRRSRTYYGLTDQRVIIMSGWFGRSVNSISLMSLPDMQLKEKSNGSGSIVFGSGGFKWNAGFAWPGMPDANMSTIEFVDNVRSVYNQILAAQKGD